MNHRYQVYRIEGLTRFKTPRVYIGIVDTTVNSVAQRAREHLSHGSKSAAWLRCVDKFAVAVAIDSAPTLALAVRKELVHTGWALRKDRYVCVRGACVLLPSEKGARTRQAEPRWIWERQLE